MSKKRDFSRSIEHSDGEENLSSMRVNIQTINL